MNASTLDKINQNTNTAKMAILVVVVVLQTVTLSYSLRTTPSEVLAEVKTVAKSLDQTLTRLDERVESIDAELENRGQWMQGVDNELETRTKDRLFRSEFDRWLKNAKELNPDLPDLPDDENTQAALPFPR
jgi:hypothetical protein